MLNFPESSSNYTGINLHLEDKYIDTFVLHVGVNDLLNYNSQPHVDSLMSNIHKIIGGCKQVGVTNIFVPGLVYSARVSLPIQKRFRCLVSNHCHESACFYTDNRNIREFCFYKDSLYL